MRLARDERRAARAARVNRPLAKRVKVGPRTKVRVCCYSCEFEWNGDKLACDADCPWCGAQGGDGEAHTLMEWS